MFYDQSDENTNDESDVLLLGISIFSSAFSSQPEHVVTKNGVQMVACVDAFTDVYVYYYPYKNVIFRGREKTGEEWYGSGGYDPFTIDMEVTPKRSTFDS